MPTVTTEPSIAVTLASKVTSAPTSSSGTTTGRVNRTAYAVTAAGSPTQSVTTRSAAPMVSIPWAITPGSPTWVAKWSE